MASFTEPNYDGDLIKWEAHRAYSREVETVASGQNLAQFAVVGRVTASGEMAEFNPSAADGSETAAGILIEAVDASSAARKGVVLERVALVDLDFLVWKSGLTQAQKDAALATLKGLGIVARSAP